MEEQIGIEELDFLCKERLYDLNQEEYKELVNLNYFDDELNLELLLSDKAYDEYKSLSLKEKLELFPLNDFKEDQLNFSKNINNEEENLFIEEEKETEFEV